ncbi:MAG: hypothetical protein OXF33_03135 [Rhodospirillales bacterium]|nr:hypothetical protein [Rhodospirillales bacterium]
MSLKDQHDTRQRLARITDAGEFEKLATAVLREQEAHCRRLAHVGVNAKGKTVKSPVDAIVYTSVGGQRHLLAVHHTTCGIEDLRRKWLTNPDSDLRKTMRELEVRRENTPELGATLILTTNKDPQPKLIHEVECASGEARIEIKIWTGSALAHFLDFDPKGQWLRKSFLGVAPTRLSRELLGELSVRSVELAQLQDDPERWVKREVEAKLRKPIGDQVQFVLGNSGIGKSVACLKCLQQHVRAGGFGLIVTDEVLGAALTVEDSIERTLRNLQPSLAAGAGSEALSLMSENEQLLLIIEDINRSAQPSRLVEKLAAWSARAKTGKGGVHWRILCPVWPRTFALAGSNTETIGNQAAALVTSFAPREGVAAVKRRRRGVTDLEAEAVASALGFDPLLIALHGGSDATPEPETVIQSYVERELQRIAATDGTYTAGEYRDALRRLALEMLDRSQLEPTFAEIRNWTVKEIPMAAMLRDLARHREVIRLEGTTENQRVVFRHDRVRDHLLADSIKDAVCRDELSSKVLSDPYFAEVIGMAIARSGIAMGAIDKVVEVNPLALFCALRHCSRPQADPAQYLVKAAKTWAAGDAWRDSPKEALRFAVLRVLAECDGSHVRGLCETLGQGPTDHWSLRGRFRNGDLSAGVGLCAQLPPGVGWAGHVELIDHVVKKGGSRFILALGGVLRERDLPEAGRRGALRLAGFVASSELAGALRETWVNDHAREELLSDYFWACAQCCGDDPSGLLGPIVDTWAAMSDENEGHIGSPRIRFGANELRWAFQNRVPRRAISYFLQRARSPELRWPVVVLLDGIDHPDAVEFVVRELAKQDERLEATGHISPFATMAVREWRRRQEPAFSDRDGAPRGRSPMSAASRERLKELWACDRSGKHLRRSAFRFWSATVAEEDVPILRTIDGSSEIAGLALFERLRRSDRQAVPALVEKLDSERSGYWWQAGRYLWTDELTDCLDRELACRADELKDAEGNETHDPDWILAERLTELAPSTAEPLIVKHWAGLRHSAYYVGAALHVASPELLARTAEVVAASDDPNSLFKHLGIRWGYKVEGRSGVTRCAQMNGLLPYLDYLSDADITMLWDACNKNRWFEWRRQHLDSRASAMGTRFVDDAAAIKELDQELEGDGPLFRMHRWGEMFLETGVSVDHMMEVVGRWVSDQDQNRALSIAADLVKRFGTRRHVELLKQHTLAESQFGEEVIRNADFEMRLRSLG